MAPFFRTRLIGKPILAALAGLALTGAVPAAHATPGKAGWQAPMTVTIPTGQTDAFLHFYCPDGFSVTNGAFFAATNTTLQNGFIATGAGPRLDLSPPLYNEWVWNFEWPLGGAAAGSQVILNINCKKGAP